MVPKMNHITIRMARQEDAAHIAGLFMLAWPIDEILESNGISYGQLQESIMRVAASRETIYSYENTVVAEVDGKIVGIAKDTNITEEADNE